MFAFTLFALGFAHLALAKTVHYRWDITWVRAAPDGFERSVIGINGQWPCPQIDVDLGDKVVVHMHNALGNQSTSLHWHGLHQNGTQEMDGASGVTQCPVAPGHSFTYEFMVSFASTSLGMYSLSPTGRPAGHILVSLAYYGPVSGWAVRSAHHP